MDYLNRYGDELPNMLLAMNVDDVGYARGRTGYSFYGSSPDLKSQAIEIFQPFDGLVQGEQWFNGDHMIFVQNNVPSLAFTSECIPELMRTVTHTSADIPEIIDCQKLIELAESLVVLLRSL